MSGSKRARSHAGARRKRRGAHLLVLAALSLAGAVGAGGLAWLAGPAVGTGALGALLLVIGWLLVVSRREAAARHRSLQARATRLQAAVRGSSAEDAPVTGGGASRALASSARPAKTGQAEGERAGAELGAPAVTADRPLVAEIAREQADISRRLDEVSTAVLRLARGAGSAREDQTPVSIDQELSAVAASGLFDADWYRAQHPQVIDDPLEHYVWRAPGSDPHPLFDGSWYLRQAPEAPGAWRTLLAHYLEVGWRRGLSPHPLLEPAWFEQHADAEGPVLQRYLQQAGSGPADPNPLFDRQWYLARYRPLLVTDEDPLVHYVREGAARGLAPSPWFDPAEHRRRVLGCRPSDDPLRDFLVREREGRLPPADLAPRPSESDPNRWSCDEAELRWDHLVSGAYRLPQTFVLTRILGNDLPPRHREGQTLDNLRFILDHEPELPGCEKRWVVNRIVDPAQEAAIIALLEEREQPYLHRPFELENYAQLGWSWEGLADTPVSYRGRKETRDRILRLDRIYGEKTRYVIDINGARNAAIEDGRQRATWVLPWDGGCFLTRRAWDELREQLARRPYVRYVAVPTARAFDNRRLLWPDFEPYTDAEPMLALRCDASERFDESRAYSRHDKIALLIRLGIPGTWDGRRWDDDPEPASSPEAGQFLRGSWVARLAPGDQGLETSTSARRRHRSWGVRGLVDDLDGQLARERLLRDQPLVRSMPRLEEQRARWRAGDPVLAPVVDSLLAQDLDGDALTPAAAVAIAGLQAWLTGERCSEDPVPAAIAELAPESAATNLSADVPVLLDGVRLLAAAGALSPDSAATVGDVVRQRAHHLDEAGDQADRREAADGHGTWYDVERLALAVYLGDVESALTTLRRSQERLLEQFDETGASVTEPCDEATGPERVLVNLQGWSLLCRLSIALGGSLAEVTADGRSVRRALSWAIQRFDGQAPPAGPMTEAVHTRLALLAATAPGVDPDGVWPVAPPPDPLPDVPPTGWGVPPYWRLG